MIKLHIPCGDVKNQTIRITDHYGYRQDPWNPAKIVLHSGVDLRSYNVPNGPQGAIYAVESGTIIDLRIPDAQYPASHDLKGRIPGIPAGRAWTPYMMLKGDSGSCWFYMHVKPLASKGRVEIGQQIAVTDRNYGYSNAIHLHFEHWLNQYPDSRTDPMPALRASGIRVVQPEEWDKMLLEQKQ